MFLLCVVNVLLYLCFFAFSLEEWNGKIIMIDLIINSLEKVETFNLSFKTEMIDCLSTLFARFDQK